MRAFKSWRWLLKKRLALFDGGTCGAKMKPLPFMGVVCTVMLFIVYRTTNYQYRQTEMESRLNPFYTLTDSGVPATSLNTLPRGIIEARSDLELKPLWSGGSKSEDNSPSSKNLLAIPVGIKQKRNVNRIIQKFLPENFTIVLFHYDGHVDGWRDLEWSKNAIHVVAFNQTKWWFAKRFLHPAVVSPYDYIFLWDEDLGVEHFHPGRYLEIVKSEGLEISQPALDPNSTGIHHRITIRQRSSMFHRRVYDIRGSTKCSDASDGPPCTGFVEGMAPVFSRAAWHCAWHLIQTLKDRDWELFDRLSLRKRQITINLNSGPLFENPSRNAYICLIHYGDGEKRYILHPRGAIIGDTSFKTKERLVCFQFSRRLLKLKSDLVHGWGMDMKLGYCAQGDRRNKVGVVDSEYIVHQSIQTLGGQSAKKRSIPGGTIKRHQVDVRSEIRRQSTSELQTFEDRWERAVKEDRYWTDPYKGSQQWRRRRIRRRHHRA